MFFQKLTRNSMPKVEARSAFSREIIISPSRVINSLNVCSTLYSVVFPHENFEKTCISIHNPFEIFRKIEPGIGLESKHHDYFDWFQLCFQPLVLFSVFWSSKFQKWFQHLWNRTTWSFRIHDFADFYEILWKFQSLQLRYLNQLYNIFPTVFMEIVKFFQYFRSIKNWVFWCLKFCSSSS